MFGKFLKDFLNGVIFGITQTVPGVSAGTVAIILGFYNELLEAVNHFFKDVHRYVKFLFPLLAGAAFGLFVFSFVVQFLLNYYSFPTMLFFIGLIVGVIPPVYRRAMEGGKPFKAYYLIFVALPFLILVFISHVGGRDYAVNPAEVFWQIDGGYMLFLLAGGVVAGASLLLPGVSGSFVLLLMGIYPVATYAIASSRFLLGDITNISLILNIGFVLAPLGIGTVVGALATARLVEKLLREHEKMVYLVILGLLGGSVYTLIREPIVFVSGTDRIVLSIAAFCSGCFLSYKLGKV